MEDDSIVSLACSMYAKKGIYALLLGSGVSRAAGIPTGWDITNRLIEKIAGQELSNPSEWYQQKSKKQADYSEIIKRLGKTPAERSLLLREYFEPALNDDNRLKRPTKAHKSVARLIKEGYIKVIVTTNFDRLLEQALFDEGIVPEVITNIDQIKGATPLSLSDCVIIKVHGDYKDARIRNTESELANYEPDLRKYIDRIFDEFGLIICGWSGDWDIALRGCLERCKSHRFTTYWLHVGEPSEKAEGIIKQRWAEKISIENANNFFEALEEKLKSLNDLSLRNQNLNIDIACENLKRWVPDKSNFIRIRELIINEARFVISVCDKKPKKESPLEPVDLHSLEESMKKLSKLVIILCYYSDELYDDIIIDVLEILTKQQNVNDDCGLWDYYYPASIFICSILLCCIRVCNYNLLLRVLNHKFRKRNSHYQIKPYEPISVHLYHYHAGNYDGNFYGFFKSAMNEFVADGSHYDQLYDKAHCLMEMFYNNIRKFEGIIDIRVHSLYHNFKELFTEELSEGNESKLLSSGFFNGDIDKLVKYIERLKKANSF